MSLNRTFSN